MSYKQQQIRGMEWEYKRLQKKVPMFVSNPLVAIVIACVIANVVAMALSIPDGQSVTYMMSYGHFGIGLKAGDEYVALAGVLSYAIARCMRFLTEEYQSEDEKGIAE